MIHALAEAVAITLVLATIFVIYVIVNTPAVL